MCFILYKENGVVLKIIVANNVMKMKNVTEVYTYVPDRLLSLKSSQFYYNIVTQQDFYTILVYKQH